MIKQNTYDNYNSSSGFTYIELILYIAVLSLMLTSLVTFAWNVINAGTKSATQENVSSQARYVSERIKFEIRSASGLTTLSASSVTLSNSVAAHNPTVIDMAQGRIRIRKAGGAIINLHSDSTTGTINFTNYSNGTLSKHIGFTLVFDESSSSRRQEFKVPSITIQSSAEIRTN